MKKFIWIVTILICFLSFSVSGWCWGEDGWGPPSVPYIKKTSTPTVTDHNFGIPYLWVDTVSDKLYLLIDNTPGAADWQEVVYVGGSPSFVTVKATTFDTNVAAAGLTLSGTTLGADGADSNIDTILLPKGSGVVSVSGTTDYENNVTDDDDLPNRKYTHDLVTDQDLDTAGDSGTGAVDLDSQSLTIAGTTNRISTVASNQTITISTPQNIHTGASPTFVTTKLSGLGDGLIPYHIDDSTGFGDSPVWTDGTDVGIGTATPAGALHTVLSAGHPAIFGGGTIGVFTACTFLTATKTQISKTGIGTGMDEGDLVIVTGGTGATVGEYRAVTIDSADLITVDRDIHAEGSNITDGAVKTAKNVVVISVSDGTNGQRIMNYSHQDKPLQIGGDELVATGHSLGSEDVLIGGKLEVDGPVYFDGDNVFYAGNTFTAGLKIPGVAYLRLGDGVVGNGTLHPNTSTDQLEFLIDDGLGRQIVIGDYEWRSLDFDHATTTNPTVFIHSVISPNTSNNQWGSFTHDQEDFVITTGVETGAGDGATTIPNAISFAPQGTVAQRMLVANGIAYNLFGVTEIDSQTDEDSTSDTNLTSSATASYQVGDVVLVWSGTEANDYGLYYIEAIPDGTNITVNRALTATHSDVDYYVLRGGYIMSPDGLVLPSLSRRILIAANPNLSHPTNTPTHAIVGTYHALGFDDNTDNALITFEVPTDWDGVSDFVLKTYYAFAGNLDDTETYKIDISYRARAVGEDLDTGSATTGTFTETIDTAAGEGTLGRMFRSNITLSYLDGNNPLTKEDVVGISIVRDDSTDTDTDGEILITQWEIEYISTTVSAY